MRLLAAIPKGSRTDRIRARAFADGYGKAATDIAEALSRDARTDSNHEEMPL